jgi:ring-1,2-phenylacetyl-CoA epoxidase subunit PaaC
MTQQEALFKYLLRLGDTSLVHSQRLSEWCSNAPFIEEDLALTNFALDMIGRSQVLLKYAGEVEGKGKTDDMLAYRRNERQYFNCLLVEMPNGDFGVTMVRLLFVAAFEKELFTALQNSKDETIAALAKKTLKEVRYHLEHAADWVVRLGNGTEESHARVQNAVNDLWMFTGDMFDMDESDKLLIEAGIAVDLSSIKTVWDAYISSVLNAASLKKPVATYMQSGSKNGIHTEHLGHLLGEMQYLQRAYPDAHW